MVVVVVVLVVVVVEHRALRDRDNIAILRVLPGLPGGIESSSVLMTVTDVGLKNVEGIAGAVTDTAASRIL